MNKLTILIISFLLLSFSVTNGQEKDTLSLKSYKELSSLISKTFLEDIEVSKGLTNYYINKAQKETNVSEEINGLTRYIDIRVKSREFDDFKEEQDEMFALATTDELEELLIVNLYLLGNSYFFQGLLGESINLHSKALDLARKHGKIEFESIILTQLGYVKSATGDHVTSIAYQKQALALNRAKRFDNSSIEPRRLNAEVSLLYFISRSYINSKLKDSAKSYINEAISLNELVKDSCLGKALYRTKGEVNLLYNKYKEAISNLDYSKTYCLPLSKTDSLMYSSAYGKAYIGLKEYKKAQSILQKGIDDYNVTPEEEGFMDDHYKLLAKAYKYNNNIEKSNLYFEKYIHTTEEFNRIQDTVVGVFKQQELKAFEAELEAINSEKTNFKYILGASSFIIIALLFFLFRFNKLKKKNEEKFNRLLETINAGSVATLIETKDDIDEKEGNVSGVSTEVKIQILQGLQKLESQEYYLRKDCNSYNVAKKIKTNTSYLSKVVNSHYQKNFNSYINDLRINYAVLKLKNDSRFRKFSIQSIAEEVGYKSADSFTKYFKKQTGLNPSFFIKKLNDIS